MSTLVPIAFMHVGVKYHPDEQETIMVVHINRYVTGNGGYVLKTNKYYREDDSLFNILRVFFSELWTVYDYVQIKEIKEF